MAATNTVVAATTETATYAFRVRQGCVVVVAAYNLGSGEAIDIEKEVGEDVWVDCYTLDGTQLQLTPTVNPIAIDAPGWYRMNKPLTASAVSLHLDA